ncbi:hypothetical protein [Pseudarthrobacter sp. NS4]|uniref:hypothetical protein n=1 Tax=Pseudarthrobacter sp. NS4 TaxID=2973976 RepID=UPI002867BF7B|nr:hypothetical protein [Pseudarthrobacter sp. NS4]
MRKAAPEQMEGNVAYDRYCTRCPHPGPPKPRFLQVIAESQESLQDGLDRAVEQVRAAAAPGDRRGILIIRRSRSLFTVEASTDVPYGIMLEKDRWHRPSLTRSMEDLGALVRRHRIDDSVNKAITRATNVL